MTATLSEQATLRRFDASQDRMARDFGYGDTAGALGITRDCLEPLAAFIDNCKLNSKKGSRSVEGTVLHGVRRLSSELLALAALNGVLHAIATTGLSVKARGFIGRALQLECWHAELMEHDGELAARIEAAVRRKHGQHKYRIQAARSIAKRAAFAPRPWSETELQKAGGVVLGWIALALPDVFVVDGEHVTVTEEGLESAEQAVERCLQGRPMFFPMTEPPKDWTSWFEGGYWDERSRLKAPIVRTTFKECSGAIRAAIKDGSMQPHLDALNTLQAVPWAINTRVLEVLNWAYENNVPVPGLPPRDDVPMPAKPAAWDDMDEAAKRVWKYRAGQVKERNRSYVSNRVLMKQDTETAAMLVDAGRFYTPMNCDWRGRVYPITHFNFQRDDRVRALFLFADGQPIGEEGLYWLKVHTANCGGFDRINKQPIEERVKWVDQHLDLLRATATTPTTDTRWLKADTPFLFLAACMELTSAMAEGSSFVTRVPVSFDGSCSGLQHLCAMTRAPEGSLVNLAPLTRPQDVYQSVADLVTQTVAAQAAGGEPTAQLCHAYFQKPDVKTRDIVKRNVMTYSYSSKKFGMAHQLQEDLMRPLAFQVLSGAVTTHPFGDEDGREAAKYLAGLTYDAIETLVHLPAQAMAMLQKCARAMAHEGKPVTWTTPLGLPWINCYHAPNLKQLDLWLHDTRIQARYAEGHKKEIDKNKTANGVAPNFVHACDAAHLLMVASACAREDITQVATVHDSFGCLAPQAARFRQIIREQFVELYEKHDVLKEVLDQSKHDLTLANQQRLPELPAYGPLNLKEVLDADYAFA